jgi:hypothetical protein
MLTSHNLKLDQPATEENLQKSFPQYIILTPKTPHQVTYIMCICKKANKEKSRT